MDCPECPSFYKLLLALYECRQTVFVRQRGATLQKFLELLKKVFCFI